MEIAEQIVPSRCKLGEGPLWHVDEQALYWLDIYQEQVHRFHPESGLHEVYQLQAAITSLGRRREGIFIASTTNGIAFWNPPSAEPEQLVEVEAGIPYKRFNDGGVDRQGRFWAGTIYDGPKVDPEPEGSLYRFDGDHSLRVMETGLLLSNGLGWSPDSRTMYLTDSHRKCIFAYDFDPGSGALANRRILISTEEETGVPDGLTVDSQGFIWSARWGGWKIQRFDPAGKLEREISIPVECPSSCTFGGPDLSDLYITSAWKSLNEKQKLAQPQAGDLFRVHTGISGLPAPLFSG